MNRSDNVDTAIVRSARMGASVLLAVAIFVPLFSLAEAAQTADYVWLEAETPTGSNVPVEPTGWGNVQYLSSGQWLHYAVGENDAEKTVPQDGAAFDYKFRIPAAGKYELWDRIGFESTGTPFQWRIDEGPWREVNGKELTTDLMEIAFFCEISWLRLGEVDLTEGRHMLHIRVPVTYREDQGAKKPNGVNFTADAFCVYKGRFRPTDAQGCSWVLKFPCNSMITTVFVNGVQCGWTRAPLAPWECDITRAIQPGRKNKILVGIKDTYYAMARDARTKFHIPDDHWRAQWTTEQFDFPVAGRLESGILLAPSLVVSGPAYAADVFAMPSVKNQQLALEITLRNPTGANLRVTVANEIVPLAGGPPEMTFAPVAADLPAGKEVVIKPVEAWQNPKLWWPDDPQQYLVVTKVLVGDKVVDTTKTKFGFRQWEWDGPELKLNGIAWHGRADTTPGTPAQIKERGQNMVRLWGSPLQVSEQQLDELDAAGLPARWTGIFDGQGGAYGNFLGDPIDTLWQLKVAGRVVQEGRRTFHLTPGTAEEFAVSLKTPSVNDRTPAQFVLSCSRGGKEVYREVKQAAILPTDAAPKPQTSATDLLVLDPQGTVRSHLTRRGIAFTEVARFEDLPETGKVVVIGKDALDPRQATDPKLLALAAAGARVLVLEQQHPLHYLALPADLEVSSDTGRVAFAENLNHPVFEGLAQQDFSTWSQDHIVYRNAYRKGSRGAISLVQCDEELRDTAMAACPVNDGLLLVCQLVVGEKLGFDPVAQRLFDNLLNYGFRYAPVRKQTAVVMPADGPEAKLLAASGLKFETAADIVAVIADTRQEIVVALASPANLRALADHLEQVRAFTDRGGSLMLWGLDDKGLADFNRVVGVEHLIRPFEMERVTLPAQSDPLLSGLTMRDVVMESSQQITQWAGDRFASSDQFTSIVDVDDVAPFASIPDGPYWGYDDSKPGWDHWPRNMFNGFTLQDSWKYAFTIVTDRSATATQWSMTYPHELEFTDVSILFSSIFSQVNKVNVDLTYDPSTQGRFGVPALLGLVAGAATTNR